MKHRLFTPGENDRHIDRHVFITLKQGNAEENMERHLMLNTGKS